MASSDENGRKWVKQGGKCRAGKREDENKIEPEMVGVVSGLSSLHQDSETRGPGAQWCVPSQFLKDYVGMRSPALCGL